MATKTSQASGNWATGSTWVGGAVPADGDDIVISAGHAVLMNADLSAWTGLFSVTIQGSSGTPGMLYFKDGTNGYLKVRAGYTILGTTGANKGRLLVNSDGVWGNTDPLVWTNTAVIDLQTTAYIDATYLSIFMRGDRPGSLYARVYGTRKTVTCDSSTDTFTSAAHGLTDTTPVAIISSVSDLPEPLFSDRIYYIHSATTDTFKLAYYSGGILVDLLSNGSGTLEILTGHTNTSTAVVNVLDDVSSDTFWSTTSGKNTVCLVDTFDPVLDYQRLTLSGKTAGTLTLSANVDSAQLPLARVVFTYRNVAIRANVTSSSGMIRNAVDAYTDAEHRNTASTGSSYYSYVHDNGVNCTVDGAVTGMQSIFYTGSGNTFDSNGICSSCYYPFNNTDNIINNGEVVSSNYAFVGCCMVKNTGTILGSARAFSTCQLVENVGNVGGCSYLHYSSNGVIDSGYSWNINNAFYASFDVHHSGQIYGVSSNLTGSTASNNILSGSYVGFANLGAFSGETVFRNAIVGSGYSLAARNTVKLNRSRFCFENENRVSGANRIICAYGDIAEKACDGTSGAPSVDPLAGNGKCLKVTPQSFCSKSAQIPIFDKHRLWCSSGSRTITYRIQSQYALAAHDIDLFFTYMLTSNSEEPSVVYPAINARSSASDWSQSIQASFTQAIDGWVTLSMVLKKYDAAGSVFVWPTPVVA